MALRFIVVREAWMCGPPAAAVCSTRTRSGCCCASVEWLGPSAFCAGKPQRTRPEQIQLVQMGWTKMVRMRAEKKSGLARAERFVRAHGIENRKMDRAC
jgi:hypothetical protein